MLGEARMPRQRARRAWATPQRARRRLARRRLDRLVAVSSFGDASASIAAHTTNAWWPWPTSSAIRSQTRANHAGLLGERRDEASRCRRGPPGIVRIVETSRSPKTVIATVRGIGVAVSTSACGGCAPSRAATRAARRRTGAARRRRRGRGRRTSWCRSRSACVPTTMRAWPDAARSSGLAALGGGHLPGEQRGHELGATGRARASARSSAGAAPASTSVGAMQRRLPAGLGDLRASRAGRRASCPSRPRPARAGSSASRPRGRRRSGRRPRAGRRVSGNGSDASKPLEQRPRATAPRGRQCAHELARCCSSATCSTNASCMRSVRRACSIWSSNSGRWMRSMARRARRAVRRAARTSSGQRIVDGAEPVEHEVDRSSRSCQLAIVLVAG